MSVKILLPVFVMTLLSVQSTQAQAVTCPRDLKWTDATYVQRSTGFAGRIIVAETERFTNATVSRFDSDGVPSALIVLGEGSNPKGISLTSGARTPKPQEFAEMGIVVAPPMTSGAWPKLSRPCVIEEGALIRFNETELASSGQDKAPKMPKIKGSLQRLGLRVDYSMVVENGPDSERGTETLQGVWKYAPTMRTFSLDTDVQGWHVYRSNTYLMTLPVGAKISLATLLKRVADAPSHTKQKSGS